MSLSSTLREQRANRDRAIDRMMALDESPTPNVDAFLDRKGASVIPPHARPTIIAYHGTWVIRSYDNRPDGPMFDAFEYGTTGITPGFESIAELVAFLRR